MTSGSNGRSRSMAGPEFRRAGWALCLALASPTAALAEPRLHSGVYENLLLAVTPQHQIVGAYREVQGEGVEKSCAFYLTGKTDASPVAIETWSDAKRPGVLEARDDGVTLRIENGRDHAGCGLVLLPQIASGLALDSTAPTNWIGLATASAAKVYLYAKPDEARKGKAYVIAHDVLGVSARQGDWLDVEFRKGGKSLKGWVHATDVTEIGTPP